MELSLEELIALCFGLLGGVYVAFIFLKPTSKLDFLIRGSVSLLTGYIFTDTLAVKLDLETTPAAFIASCGAWPFIGLVYMVCTDPKHLIELIKAWKK